MAGEGGTGVIESVFACRRRARMVARTRGRVLPVDEAERRLCGVHGTFGALRRLAQPVADAHLVTVAVRRADGGVHFIKPQSAYRRARAAGWRFVRRRPRPDVAPRWFWYRKAEDVCGGGLPLREDAALEALAWDGIRPPAEAVAAASDPRIELIAWYPSGRSGWRNRIGERRTFRRLPGGAWCLVSIKVVDLRRCGPAEAGWIRFCRRGGVLARSTAAAVAADRRDAFATPWDVPAAAMAGGSRCVPVRFTVRSSAALAPAHRRNVACATCRISVFPHLRNCATRGGIP